MRKITTCLWFDTQGEEAATFYTSIFENSKLGNIARYGEGAPQPAGSVITVDFELDGHPFVALNGGPQFSFTEAISMQVNCETQHEIDRLWNALSEGGEEGPCGWLKDKFGLSWQITPTVLADMVSDPDPRKAQRVMNAMFGMRKLDIAALRQAYDQA